MELGSWIFCANGLGLGRYPVFNEASLLIIRLVVWIFYISRRRDIRKDLTFSCGEEIALEIEDRRRIVMVTDCCAVHGDILLALSNISGCGWVPKRLVING